MRSTRSWNLNDFSYTKQINGLIRLREMKLACMENRLFQENHARDGREIQELRRICCEETDRARQARIDELSMHQEKNPTTVGQLLGQIRELQKRENFTILLPGSSSGATHVPSQFSTILSPRTMPRRDSGLPHDTRNILGTSGNVFERPPAQGGGASTVNNNSKNLASSSQELRPDVNAFTTFPKWRWHVESYWWNLFSQ